MVIAKGTKVEDFVLKDHNDENFRLIDHKGKKILISSHPLAWTSVCAKQMQALDEQAKVFEQNNTIVVGLSTDPVPTKTAWAKKLGIEQTPLLSDFWPHGEVSKQLGLFLDDLGFAERANVLLDENHQVMFAKTYPLAENPDINEIIEQITQT